MKIACAWCDKVIRVSCPHCHSTLAAANYPGSTFAAAYVCLTGETPITFSAAAIREMRTSHGICDECSSKTPTELDAITRRKRALAHLGAAASDDANMPYEKRGPTGLTPSATVHTPTTPKKSGKQ